MAALVFGQTIICRPCNGTGVIGGMTCASCDGAKVLDATTRRAPVARATDPDTSWAAARSIPEDQLRESQRVILAILRERGPMTDERIAEWLDNVQHPISPSGARTRRAELVNAGYVRDSGKRDRLPTGRMAVVWEAIRASEGMDPE